MADYPQICAVGLGLLAVIAWWRTRDQPRRAAAALWVLVAGAASFAVAQTLMGPHAQPSLRHVTPGSSTLLHPAFLFPAPSGTAAMAGAMVTGLFLVGRRYGIAGAAAAALIGVFQIGYEEYAESDVVAAGLVGFAIVLCGYAVLGAPLERLVARLWPHGQAS